MNKPNLIVTCDDCGLSRGINEATRHLYERGMATTASVLMNFPATEHALEILTPLPDLNLGVHLNLSDGFPLMEMTHPSELTYADGRFRPRYYLYTQSLIADKHFLDVAALEMEAQIRAFLDAGLAPKHLSTHIHFHIFPALRQITFRLAKQFNIPWVRAYKLDSSIVPYNLLLKDVTPTSEDDESDDDGDPPRMPDYVIGLYAWQRYDVQQLAERLLTLNGNIEIVVHPCSIPDDSYPAEIPFSPEERNKEMTYYMQLYEMLAQSGEWVLNDPVENI